MERLASTRERTSTRPHVRGAAGEAPAAQRNLAIPTTVVRVVGAVLVMATGAIHLYLYQHYYSAVPTIGRLFVANFVVAMALGVVLLVRPRAVWCLLGAAFCLGTLAAFLISVHWGLFGFQETLRGAWQERAAVVEIAGAAACAFAALLSVRTVR